MARQKFEPTPEQRTMVSVLVACGTPHPAICRHLINPFTSRPIDAKTLRRVFRSELDDGMVMANSLVAQSLFKRATGSGPQSITAAIFWLKTRAGWKETVDVESDIDSARKMREQAAEMERATCAAAPVD